MFSWVCIKHENYLLENILQRNKSGREFSRLRYLVVYFSSLFTFYSYVLGLGDCINFTITIIAIKTSRFPIISDYVTIWRRTTYL